MKCDLLSLVECDHYEDGLSGTEKNQSRGPFLLVLCTTGRWHANYCRWWFRLFFVIFTPKYGKWSSLTNIFQRGWFNHQLDKVAKYDGLSCSEFAASSRHSRCVMLLFWSILGAENFNIWPNQTNALLFMIWKQYPGVGDVCRFDFAWVRISGTPGEDFIKRSRNLTGHLYELVMFWGYPPTHKQPVKW